jgi:predicted acylesterase/phospholipase RssA
MFDEDNTLRGDVLLSSGYLGFASHLGFLAALAHASFEVQAAVGTSSGALVGSLFAAKWPPDEIERFLRRSAPIRHVGWGARPWRGVFDLRPMITLLRKELPPRFEDLSLPFGVGVSTVNGEHRLITTGDLAVAVAASCAVPRLFTPVSIDGIWYRDGGATDRLGVRSWRSWRPNRAAIVHQIQRSMGAERSVDLQGLPVVCSPRSNNSLWRLRNFDAERKAAFARTTELFATHRGR